MHTSLLDLLLPDTCIQCLATTLTREKHLCCEHCWASLTRIENPCLHCARELPDGDICGACLTHPLSVGRAVIPFAYRDEAMQLVSALKFQNNFRAARTLAHGIVEQVEALYPAEQLPEAIVPTPLSWRRHVIRGYNQTERLADEISNALDVPIKHLLRRKHGPTQHDSTRATRQSLPMSAFSSKGTCPSHIALIDDVVTTGTTMRVMAKVCQRAGARRVDLWAACRTPESHASSGR